MGESVDRQCRCHGEGGYSLRPLEDIATLMLLPWLIIGFLHAAMPDKGKHHQDDLFVLFRVGWLCATLWVLLWQVGVF